MKNDFYAIEALKSYKKQFDVYLEKYFSKKIAQAKKLDPLAVQSIEIIRDFILSGGKRVRPALVYYGYLSAGGKEKEEIIKASMAIELAHAFLLIHDDIIDRDDMRHGIDTVHVTYEKMGKTINLSGSEAVHFGNSMAIVCGDYAHAMASDILCEINFASDVVLDAIKKIQQIVSRTIPGEMLDVLMGMRGSATEDEVMRMYDAKTARYTFEGPLQLGVVLAGQKENVKLLESFSQYASPVGIAFQLQDDILGIFGNEDKLGKSVGADIIEGKQTLLVVKALEKASPKENNEIKRLLGKKDLTKREIGTFREIITTTGSLKYSQDLAKKLVNESLDALRCADIENIEARKFLEGIAQYIITREV